MSKPLPQSLPIATHKEIGHQLSTAHGHLCGLLTLIGKTYGSSHKLYAQCEQADKKLGQLRNALGSRVFLEHLGEASTGLYYPGSVD